MKNTGIVRKLDELGRITLPIELRRNLELGERGAVEMWVDSDTVVLKKYGAQDKCNHCGTTENIIKSDDVLICKKCASKIIGLFK